MDDDFDRWRPNLVRPRRTPPIWHRHWRTARSATKRKRESFPSKATAGTNMVSFSSTDGGASWNASLVVASITDHLVAGSLRTSALPSAIADAGGTVYVVWQDCRFRTGCASNDIVLSTSTDGNTWLRQLAFRSTQRPVRSTISSDRSASILRLQAAAAHLGLTYYYYPVANCTTQHMPADCVIRIVL